MNRRIEIQERIRFDISLRHRVSKEFGAENS
jgi:hypothetical protein